MIRIFFIWCVFCVKGMLFLGCGRGSSDIEVPLQDFTRGIDGRYVFGGTYCGPEIDVFSEDALRRSSLKISNQSLEPAKKNSPEDVWTFLAHPYWGASLGQKNLFTQETLFEFKGFYGREPLEFVVIIHSEFGKNQGPSFKVLYEDLGRNNFNLVDLGLRKMLPPPLEEAPQQKKLPPLFSIERIGAPFLHVDSESKYVLSFEMGENKDVCPETKASFMRLLFFDVDIRCLDLLYDFQFRLEYSENYLEALKKLDYEKEMNTIQFLWNDFWNATTEEKIKDLQQEATRILNKKTEQTLEGRTIKKGITEDMDLFLTLEGLENKFSDFDALFSTWDRLQKNSKCNQAFNDPEERKREKEILDLYQKFKSNPPPTYSKYEKLKKILDFFQEESFNRFFSKSFSLKTAQEVLNSTAADFLNDQKLAGLKTAMQKLPESKEIPAPWKSFCESAKNFNVTQTKIESDFNTLKNDYQALKTSMDSVKSLNPSGKTEWKIWETLETLRSQQETFKERLPGKISEIQKICQPS